MGIRKNRGGVMAEEKKLNIFQKIQKARVELQKKDLKKTGYNKYSNYKYFELGDFLPQINEICNNLGLYTEVQYKEKEATLTVFDCDNLESFREWTTPVEVASLKGCSTIQNIGGTQSFARRYLYIMAFEVAETDVIDSGEVDQEAIEAVKKIDKSKVATIKKLLDETHADIKKFLGYFSVERVEDLTNETFFSALKMLTEKKTKQEEKESHQALEPKEEPESEQEENFGFN